MLKAVLLTFLVVEAEKFSPVSASFPGVCRQALQVTSHPTEDD